jgi:formate hydrogenlyase subunit 3/multisubunit Na+/H+ antiporter MnhD subunit
VGIDRELLEIYSKYLIVAGAISLASAFLFCFSAYLVVKIFRLVNVKDPPLLLSIMSITCALGCFTAYITMDMLRILSFDTVFQFRITVPGQVIQ